jgi:flagellar hook assembly protein FlgD
MEQDFQLNLTASSLVPTVSTVEAPVAAPRQIAAITLLRPADVTATIETASGTRIRTLELGTLGPGTVPITWDGLDLVGDPAFTGRYELHVAATNGVGRVELVTQLAVRRVAARAPMRGR